VARSSRSFVNIDKDKDEEIACNEYRLQANTFE
jgi:hypothetical protein